MSPHPAASTTGSFSALLLFIMLVCLQAGCSNATPQLQRLSTEAVILAFGDSLTRGTGADPGHSYPDYLASSSARKVVNGGVPGELSAQGLRRLPSLLREYRPDLVILCHGGNDLLQKKAHDSIQQNLLAMINLIREHGAEVVLIGVPKPGLLLSTASLYEELADELKLPIDDHLLAGILSDPSLKADAVHPNNAGYALLAERVSSLLHEAGAL